MTRFKRILVALDLSKMDNSVIRYVQFMKNVFSPDKILLGHVVPHSLYAATYFPDPVPALAEEALHEVLKDYPGLKNNDKVEVLVGEGRPLEVLLDWCEEEEIDLLVVGLKRFHEGSGVLPRKVVRRSPCPVLFVPRMKEPAISHVWVPVDFSDPSVDAMKYAEFLRTGVKGVKVTAHHAVYLPTALTMKLTMTEAQVRKLKKGAAETFDKFVSKNELEDLKYKRVITRSPVENPAAHILDEAKSHRANLIVISPEGHSKIDLLFLGSVTEKLLTVNHEIATLVLK